MIFKSHCSIEVRNFPYDRQVCNLKFYSWIHDASELILYIQGKMPEEYIPNGQWELQDMSTAHAITYYSNFPPWSDLDVTLWLRRRSPAHTINIVIPCTILSALALLTFVLPEESGE